MAKVLIVDDDESIRQLLRRILEKGGYECSVAADALEARGSLKSESFDLILCDIKMPGESGLNLIRDLLGEYPDMAALMVTRVDDLKAAYQTPGTGREGNKLTSLRNGRRKDFVSLCSWWAILGLTRSSSHYRFHFCEFSVP